MMCYMVKTGPGKERMNDDTPILIDSDAFVGLVMQTDPHHARAKEIYGEIKAQQRRLSTTSAVVAETATVLSHRAGQTLAKTFLGEFIEAGHFPVVYITEALHHDGLEIFKSQSKKGTSVTDCLNVAVCRQLQITHIFSFDQAYPKRFGLQFVEIDRSIE